MNADDDAEKQKFALQELFRSYNNADPESVKVQVAKLVKRLNRMEDNYADENENENEMVSHETKMVEGVEVGRGSGRKGVQWCWRFLEGGISLKG